MLQPYLLEISPKTIRQHILKMAKTGNSVHIACAFSLVEIITVLYQNFIRLDKNNLKHPDRDIMCLSKGHGVMALYACLYEIGLLEEKHISNYFADGSFLKGLADAHVPGIEVSGGSLGHGVTVAVGQAFALKLKKKNNFVYCIVGDGEINEGSVWEALLFCSHWKLDNFVFILDANEYQAMGLCTEILNCEPFLKKLEAFGFDTWECNGHSVSELNTILKQITLAQNGKPKAIIARTIKGKGISFMEKNNAWHYTRLNDDTFVDCFKELAK
jgi:transketolase